MDVDKLLHALDNEDNVAVLELDYEKLNQTKNNMLQKLNLPREELKQMHKQLKAYRYIDELPDLRYGGYIRWVSLKNPAKLKLTNGGIVCDMQVKNDGLHIVCRNNTHQFFQLRMHENMLFQKLTDQEQVILSAMNYLQL